MGFAEGFVHSQVVAEIEKPTSQSPASISFGIEILTTSGGNGTMFEPLLGPESPYF